MSDLDDDLATPPPNEPITVDLARALAEAVDGFPGCKHPIFLISAYEPVHSKGRGGYRFCGPYTGWHEVPRCLRRCVRDRKCGFFGPFNTGPADKVQGRRVRRLDVHVKGEGRPHRVSTRHLDALFFSPRAVEKFALPYYERLFGPRYAEHVMKQFLKADVQVMAHYPWSEYTSGGGAFLAVSPSILQRSGTGFEWVQLTGGDDNPLGEPDCDCGKREPHADAGRATAESS